MSTQAPLPLFMQLIPAMGHLDGFQFLLLEIVLQRTFWNLHLGALWCLFHHIPINETAGPKGKRIS